LHDDGEARQGDLEGEVERKMAAVRDRPGTHGRNPKASGPTVATLARMPYDFLTGEGG
jgi:hypothetical protein